MTAADDTPAPKGWPMRHLAYKGTGESGQTDSADQAGEAAGATSSDDTTVGESFDALAQGDGAGDREDVRPAGPRSDDVASVTSAGDTTGEPVELAPESEARQAVDDAHRAALGALRGYPDRYRAMIRARSDAITAELRRQADSDVTSIRRVLAMEIARLGRQAEESVSARQEALAAQLAAETARLGSELARAQADVDAFEARLVAFEIETAEFLERMSGAAVTAVATHSTHPIPTPSDNTPSADAGAAQDHSLQWHPILAGAEGDSAGRQQTVAGYQSSGMNGATHGPLPGLEAMIGVTQERPDADEGAAPDAADAAPAPETSPADPTNTTIYVRGFSEVASISAFMRLLVRLPEVQAVQVRSEPNSEVSFAVRHSAEMDLPAVLESLPQFNVLVLSAAPGALTVAVSEPRRAGLPNDPSGAGEGSVSIG